MKEIRTLKADEIEVRIQSVKSNGCVLLIYKDARCDMKILDESFGVMGWQRTHEIINGSLYCTVEIWDEIKNQWIKKQDVGVESFTEKQKGQASDAFKRANVNVGIGRELYDAPFIWVKLSESEIGGNNGKVTCKTKFEVSKVGYTDRKITELIIIDEFGKERFKMGSKIEAPKEKSEGEKMNDLSKLIEESKSIDELKSAWQTIGLHKMQNHELLMLKKEKKKEELLNKEKEELKEEEPDFKLTGN